MSNQPRLDARAAELKEKLLLSRRTRTPSNNLGLPPANPPKSIPPTQKSSQPQQVCQDDGEDIADLIKSISAQSLPDIASNNQATNKQVLKPTLISAAANNNATPVRQPVASPGLGLQSKTPVRMPPLAANRQVQAQTKANSPEEGEIRDAAIKMEAYSSTEKAVVAQTAPPSAPKNHRVRAEQSSSNTPTQPRSTPMNRTYHGPGAQKQGTEDKLARLVEEDADLRDWLLMTNYYDVELRNKRLDRHRKVVALTAEKERIEAEQRKLIEEDEHDRMQGVVPTSVTPAPNSVPFTAPPTTVAPEQIDNSRANKEQVSAKRPLDAYEQHGRPEKYQRSSRPVSRDEFKPHAHRRTPSRGSSPPRHGHSHFRRDYSPRSRDYSPHRGPPYNVRRRSDFGEFAEHDRRYDNGYASYRRETGSDDRPVEVDLGQKGDTRFFIVKSFNEQNVERCMEDGVWATQSHNVQTLTKAFASCKNVIFFFSVNRSKAFQGYARMVTAPSPDIPKPRWITNINWEVSDPFRIEWLSKTEVEFYRIGHIKNAYNEGNAVLVGKDGQEVEEEAGRKLLKEMLAIAQAKYEARHRGRREESPRLFLKREDPEGFERDRERRGWGVREAW